MILVRSLAYDRNLSERVGSEVRLAVVVRAGDPSSEASGETILWAFRKLESYQIKGLPFRAVKIVYRSMSELEATVLDQDVDVLFVTRGLGGEVDNIAAFARNHDITTMTSRRTYVEHALALGVFVHDGRPRLLLNLPAATEEGADFGAQLLRIATVLR